MRHFVFAEVKCFVLQFNNTSDLRVRQAQPGGSQGGRGDRGGVQGGAETPPVPLLDQQVPALQVRVLRQQQLGASPGQQVETGRTGDVHFLSFQNQAEGVSV